MPETELHDIEYDLHPRALTRRRVLFVAVLTLLILALALTPPLLNVSRLRKRIATSMSQSLGRPVHLDNVTLHLLPMPGFTLENLVVSEDPAFGNEPVIRANKVVAAVRVSSLWRRQVEISRIKFIEPSLNVVRNAQGRWNLEEVLTQAAHANTAPTAQAKAGPAPRFPYIEATGGRVNLKLGDEKMPFSLTDADFALWLPSPAQWKLRLQGKPARTDTNASDTGTVALEGTLGRASRPSDVPLELHGSWSGAQLGEASRLLTGDDAGWRGTLSLEATLAGKVSAASLATSLHLNDLRRADFVPAHPLNTAARCTATLNLTIVTLTTAACQLPLDDHTPIALDAASIDLQRPAEAAGTLTVDKLPVTWAFDWARLFSQRIPTTLEPEGVIDGRITRTAGPQSTLAGSLRATLPAPARSGDDKTPTDADAKPASPRIFEAQLAATPAYPGGLSPQSLQLLPIALHPGPGAQLTLTGGFDTTGYLLHLGGSATPAQVQSVAAILPPFADGLTAALPHADKSPDQPHELDITCSRPWGAHAGCSSASHTEPTKKPTHPRRR